MNFDASQDAAIARITNSSSDHVITGHAGTGKTTVIAELQRRMPQATILAPTGKAAARLRSLGLSCRTIHSWLQWTGERIMRTGNAHHPIIIDEATMIDAWLLDAVMSFRPPRIIMVGDVAQLPAVGKGQPFHDFVRVAPADKVSVLSVCHRASGAIHRAALDIRVGNLPPTSIETGGESYRQLDTGGATSTQEQLIRWVRNGTYDPDQDVILTCLNGKGDDPLPATVLAINRAVVEVVNPRDGNEKWRVGDRVMNRLNSTELDWYNGDTGVITAIDTDGKPWVRPDGRDGEIRISDAQILEKMQLGYAFTIHKSQGSQWRRVFLVLLGAHNAHGGMITRNLVYTGATRAQSGLVILGQPSALRHSLRRQARKRTVLQRLVSRAAEEDFPL